MTRIIVGLCLVFLLTPAALAQELKRIKIGYPAISYNQIHIWVAKDAGLLKKYGLDAEIIFFRGGQMATQALVAGDPPIVNIGTVVQAGLHYRADVDDGWVAGNQRLGRHLSAAEENNLRVETVFLEQTGVLSHPNVNLIIGDRRIADF